MLMLILMLIYLGYEGQDDTNIKGGMTIYYTQKDFNSSDLENYTTAFPAVSPHSPSQSRGEERAMANINCNGLGFPHDSRQSSDRVTQRHEERPRIYMSRNHSHPWLRNA
jgi:hypothetical protein